MLRFTEKQLGLLIRKTGMVTEPFDVGLGEYQLSEGDHISALYYGPAERDAILQPYVQSALRSGDKCICVLDTAEPAHFLDSIRGGDVDGFDISACLASRQFDLVRAADTTMRSGRFSAADMIGFWKASVAGAMNAARYPCIRSVGETAMSLRDIPDARDVVRFESDLNRMLGLYPQVMLCLFDLENFGGSFLVDMVNTHPKIFINGMVFENPYYSRPDGWPKDMEDGIGTSP